MPEPRVSSAAKTPRSTQVTAAVANCSHEKGERSLLGGERDAISEIAEELASALHHHNIGRDIRGWTEVSEAFALVKDVLDATR